ncbi:hypothetical protein B0H19DRAFT_1079220 [Mycena capillaripes]|nr:hypothetical protein B0H19DRAFT_1079220 [Mycena capillaripes]
MTYSGLVDGPRRSLHQYASESVEGLEYIDKMHYGEASERGADNPWDEISVTSIARLLKNTEPEERDPSEEFNFLQTLPRCYNGDVRTLSIVSPLRAIRDSRWNKEGALTRHGDREEEWGIDRGSPEQSMNGVLDHLLSQIRIWDISLRNAQFLNTTHLVDFRIDDQCAAMDITTTTSGDPSRPFNSHILESILTICSEERTEELSDVDAVTKAAPISASKYLTMSIHVRNTYVANIVRRAILTDGYFAGWICLSKLYPTISLPSPLVTDVLTSIKVYDTIRPNGTIRSYPTHLVMTITRGAQRDSLYHVAPKNLGGKTWMSSIEYASVQRTWSNTGFEPLSPCVSFGWLGTQRKTISRADRDDCDAMTLLGAVDFDMDRAEAFAHGFTAAMDIAKRHTAAAGTQMQGVALAALLNYDLQQYVRPIQEKWVRDGLGSANLGPKAITPADWVAGLVADSTSICAYAYEGPTVYTESKVGSFAGLLVSNTHDLLYDLATSNLMSSVMYAAAAGIVEDNLHCIFATSVADAIARRLCASNAEENTLFGDNAMCAVSAWAGFSERYRTWERFVKYSRQISRSTSTRVRRIAEMAVQQVVLADLPLLNVSDAWDRLTTDATSHKLIDRSSIAYVPTPALEISKSAPPELCPTCTATFKAALDAAASDEIHAVEGLPADVVSCRAVARASAIRRAAILATEDRGAHYVVHGVGAAMLCRLGCDDIPGLCRYGTVWFRPDLRSALRDALCHGQCEGKMKDQGHSTERKVKIKLRNYASNFIGGRPGVEGEADSDSDDVFQSRDVAGLPKIRVAETRIKSVMTARTVKMSILVMMGCQSPHRQQIGSASGAGIGW